MEADFWHSCWDKEHIGFHQLDFHPWLETIARLRLADKLLVPLCGKSLDMRYFSGQYRQILGAELSDLACQQFFAEQGLQPQITAQGPYQCYEADNYQLWQGDFFNLTLPASPMDIFDRAALIALPEAMRPAYLTQLRRLMPSGRMFLLTLDFPAGEVQGPPFAISDDKVVEYFAFADKINKLAARDLTGQRFAQRKLPASQLIESLFVIDW